MPGCEPGGKRSTPFGYPFLIDTSVLLGEPAASKTALRGSTPRARACSPTWLDRRRLWFCKPADAGANPVDGPACPDGVADCTRPSEGRSPGSIPGRDTDSRGLRVCWIARQSSELQDGVQLLGGLLKTITSSGCAGLACNPAKVEVQVRFLARTLNDDAGARRYGGCVQSSFPVGSTPTGVSDLPTAGSDYILAR